MTQKEKELLLRDLSARLSYGVKGIITFNGNQDVFTLIGNYNTNLCLSDNEACHVEDFAPYLRPLSSMTDEERHEIQEILGKDIEIHDDFINIIDSSRKSFSFIELQAVFDYFNAHYLDYRGLIEKGLALPVPEGMYNEIKEK